MIIIFFKKNTGKGVILPLFLLLSICFSAQENNTLFTDRNRLQLSLQPIIYNKGLTERQIGNYELKSNPIFSGNIGLLYRFHETEKWNFQTGIVVGLQPVYNLEIIIRPEDNVFDEPIPFSNKAYSVDSFNYTIPLYVEYTNRLSSRLYLSAMGGFKVTFLGANSSLLGLSALSENEQNIVQVFGLEVDSTSETGLYPQLEFNTGLYYRGNTRLFKLSFIYNKSLKNTYEGVYFFDNLIESPRTIGTYKLSGDYFGISISTSLRRY